MKGREMRREAATILIAVLGLACLDMEVAEAQTGWKHGTTVSDAVLTQDGMLLTVDSTGVLAKWNLESMECTAHFSSSVTNARFIELAPDSKLAIIVGDQAAMIDVTSGTERAEFQRSTVAGWASPTRFVTWKQEKTPAPTIGLSVWNLRYGAREKVGDVELPAVQIQQLMPLGAGRVVIAATSTREGKIHNELRQYHLPEPGVIVQTETQVPLSEIEPVVRISEDAKRILLTGNCRTAEVLEAATLKRLATIKAPQNHLGFQEAAIKGDGTLVALGKARVELWDPAKGRLELLDLLNEERVLSRAPLSPNGPIADAFARHFLTLSGLEFTRDGTKLVGVTWRGEVVLWDISKQQRIGEFKIVRFDE